MEGEGKSWCRVKSQKVRGGGGGVLLGSSCHIGLVIVPIMNKAFGRMRLPRGTGQSVWSIRIARTGQEEGSETMTLFMRKK